MPNQVERILSPELIDELGVDLSKPTLWSDVWTIEKLLSIKKSPSVGSVSFYKSYQNEIISAEDAIFKKEWIEEAKRKGANYRLLNKYQQDQWTLGRNVRTQGVDLAISEKETADYTVDLTIAGLKEGKRILLNIVRGHLGPAETRRTIIEQYNSFNPVQVKVESVAYQAALVKDLQDSTSVPVKAYNTGGEKFDEFVGINSLATDFENGKWILPYDRSDPRTIQLVDILVDELLSFGPNGGHTGDCLMALWFANTALREVEQSVSLDTSVKSKGLYKNVI